MLATGGGAFMNAETRAAIRAKGVSVWLKADLDVLMRRVKRRADDRPLLQTDDPAETRAPADGRALSGLCAGRPHRACRATSRTRSIVDEIVAALAAQLGVAAPHRSRGDAVMTAPLRVRRTDRRARSRSASAPMTS